MRIRMRILITILSLCFLSFALPVKEKTYAKKHHSSYSITWSQFTKLHQSYNDSGPRKIFALKRNAIIINPPSQPVLFIVSGESNAGGRANNEFASSAELAPRSLKILNNANGTFEALDIGTNNLINHDALTCCGTHGVELQLANSYDSSYFSPHACYLVKCGQGGTQINQWEPGDAAYDTMVARVALSISLIQAQTGQTPILIWLYSQGINDMIAAVAPATWKAATETLFSNMRGEFDDIIGYPVSTTILVTRFDGLTPNDLDYETVIGELESEVSECFVFSTLCHYADCSDYLLDANHFQYKAFKQLIREMKSTILSHINL